MFSTIFRKSLFLPPQGQGRNFCKCGYPLILWDEKCGFFIRPKMQLSQPKIWLFRQKEAFLAQNGLFQPKMRLFQPKMRLFQPKMRLQQIRAKIAEITTLLRGPKTPKFLTENVNYLSTANFRNAKGLESWNLAQMMFMWPFNSVLNGFSKIAIFIPLGVQKPRNFLPKMWIIYQRPTFGMLKG